MKRRGELVERTFAHLYETGGRRRLHLRGRTNILKRAVVHAAGFNLGLVLRQRLGAGKPRQFQGRIVPLFGLLTHRAAATRRRATLWAFPTRLTRFLARSCPSPFIATALRIRPFSTTGC